ncbi:Uncharacterized protein BM_BM9157 [Brugia malayi]|uniref:Bm9157 n=1 Tax=Brugia malayi TaxID=6279 RepID=A0A0J9XQC5_BRUMA|nr:Uncharacterized protein BM_BM9157 [Brugia malayi]CDP92814.1 Bm9157 [Brugia malayi]VIO94053.1 Uncharacterized protein BM_BM9157 [Brugia malayi]
MDRSTIKDAIIRRYRQPQMTPGDSESSILCPQRSLITDSLEESLRTAQQLKFGAYCEVLKQSYRPPRCGHHRLAQGSTVIEVSLCTLQLIKFLRWAFRTALAVF